ncbi:hypothetical protein ACHAXN_001095 [Cyclotella atomus]
MEPLKSCIMKQRRLVITEEKEYRSEEECKTNHKKSKGVFFAFVQIREHLRILGDHPSVSSGPPISLSWDVESNEMFSVDMYENFRDQYRRSKHEFLVPASIRTEWLLDAGYTMHTIHEASQAITDARRKRLAGTTKTQLRDKADDFAENLKKTVDWVIGKKDSVGNNSCDDSPEASKPTPPLRSSSTCDQPRISPTRKQLLRRRSSAFL